LILRAHHEIQFLKIRHLILGDQGIMEGEDLQDQSQDILVMGSIAPFLETVLGYPLNPS
jgi:hypothetical protein